MKPEYKCASHKLISEIVIALLPEYPKGISEEKSIVENAVIDFVIGQIEALPVYLRFPYKIALYKFNFFSLFVYGRTFLKLGKKRKSNYIKMWSDSPLKQMRDVIKLLRSCALLQYYDHPVILNMISTKNENHEKQLQTRKN